MSELLRDLPRLRTVVTYLRAELGRAEQARSALEEREALTARRRPLAEPPEWLIERGIGTGRMPVHVHAGGCWGAGKRCAALSAPGPGRGRARLHPLPARRRPRSAGVSAYRQGGGMSPALRVIVYPPDAEAGAGCAATAKSSAAPALPPISSNSLRRAGLDPDDVRLEDPLLIEWRGGGPAVWSQDPGEE